MQEITLSLTKLTLNKFDARRLRGLFTLGYTLNGEQRAQQREFCLDKTEPIVADIMQSLKTLAKVNVQPGDDMMGSMFVIRVMQEEQTEERLYNFFVKVCDKARTIKRTTDHRDYMKLLDDISIQELKL